MVILAILIDPNAFSSEFIIWFVSRLLKVTRFHHRTTLCSFPLKFKSTKDEVNELSPIFCSPENN